MSAGAVGVEIALTRFFAVAKWSEYGYWVISLAMAGLAFSGVALAVWRDAALRRAPMLLSVLPGLAALTGACGYALTVINPFNPLALQNPVSQADQLWNIAGYYAALLPFFLCVGLFIGLSFMRDPAGIGLTYAADLAGAGAGAACALLLMYVVPPFGLVPALLPLTALAAPLSPRPRLGLGCAAAACAAGLLLLATVGVAPNEYKAVFAPLNTPGATVLRTWTLPRGYYQLLDDFTERADVDVSNDSGLLDLPGPPRSLGLYRDGNRIASIPSDPSGRLDAAYAPAALSAAPYVLAPHARALLIGSGGGFREAEARALGAADIAVLEPEPVIAGLLAHGPWRRGPLSIAAGARYDVIDVSSDVLDAAEGNVTAFTVDALARALAALRPGGIVSIPAPLRDFPVYGLRALVTARDALRMAGGDPERGIVAYRSAWNARVLIAPGGFDAARIAALRTFCDDRSFDVIVPRGPGAPYNDLPPVSLSADVPAGTDAIADDAAAVLRGDPNPSAAAFSLAPVTLDRPFFYAALKLSALGTALARIELLPQAEVGALINVAVLAQASVIAALVLAVPLFVPALRRGGGRGLLRPALYFPALGLGFLFVELFAIDRAALLLEDRTFAFALVLTGMLVCSGVGSALAARARSLLVSWLLLLVWTALGGPGLDAALPTLLTWPLAARAGLVLLALGPVSAGLGVAFPFGLTRFVGGRTLPWAWALNGAFSVAATPLANIVARELGYSALSALAVAAYTGAYAVSADWMGIRFWTSRSHAARS